MSCQLQRVHRHHWLLFDLRGHLQDHFNRPVCEYLHGEHGDADLERQRLLFCLPPELPDLLGHAAEHLFILQDYSAREFHGLGDDLRDPVRGEHCESDLRRAEHHLPSVLRRRRLQSLLLPGPFVLLLDVPAWQILLQRDVLPELPIRTGAKLREWSLRGLRGQVANAVLFQRSLRVIMSFRLHAIRNEMHL